MPVGRRLIALVRGKSPGLVVVGGCHWLGELAHLAADARVSGKGGPYREEVRR